MFWCSLCSTVQWRQKSSLTPFWLCVIYIFRSGLLLAALLCYECLYSVSCHAVCGFKVSNANYILACFYFSDCNSPLIWLQDVCRPACLPFLHLLVISVMVYWYRTFKHSHSIFWQLTVLNSIYMTIYRDKKRIIYKAHFLCLLKSLDFWVQRDESMSCAKTCWKSKSKPENEYYSYMCICMRRKVCLLRIFKYSIISVLQISFILLIQEISS